MNSILWRCIWYSSRLYKLPVNITSYKLCWNGHHVKQDDNISNWSTQNRRIPCRLDHICVNIDKAYLLTLVVFRVILTVKITVSDRKIRKKNSFTVKNIPLSVSLTDNVVSGTGHMTVFSPTFLLKILLDTVKFEGVNQVVNWTISGYFHCRILHTIFLYKWQMTPALSQFRHQIHKDKLVLLLEMRPMMVVTLWTVTIGSGHQFAPGIQ